MKNSESQIIPCEYTKEGERSGREGGGRRRRKRRRNGEGGRGNELQCVAVCCRMRTDRIVGFGIRRFV